MAGKPIDSFLVPSARIFAITLRINGAAAPLMPLFGIAGLIELVTGTLIVIGFRAAITPFIASGQMAVAYLIAHLPMGFRPIQNGGEETASIASWLHGNLRRGNVERQ